MGRRLSTSPLPVSYVEGFVLFLKYTSNRNQLLLLLTYLLKSLKICIQINVNMKHNYTQINKRENVCLISTQSN